MTSGPFVIAIAGTSGAGKSTLTEHLLSRLGNANALSFDDYHSVSLYPPVREWLAGGADPDRFETPQFIADVTALRRGKSILHPVTQIVIEPADYLILEEHFGRTRTAMRDLIDFAVYIDIPPEIAHARKLLRKGDFLPWEDDPLLFIQNLRGHLIWYLNFGRDFYLAVRNRACKDCDLLVDGMLTTERMADKVVEVLKGVH